MALGYLGLWVFASSIETSTQRTIHQQVDVDMSNKRLDQLVNQERTEHGVKPVRRSAQVCKSAQGKLDNMLEDNYWSHDNPNGKKWLSFAKFDYMELGENLAYGQATEEEVVTAWLDSPAHKEVMLKPTYTKGCNLIANDVLFQGDITNLIVSWYSK